MLQSVVEHRHHDRKFVWVPDAIIQRQPVADTLLVRSRDAKPANTQFEDALITECQWESGNAYAEMRISLLRLALSAPIMVIGGPIEIDWLTRLLAGILTLEAAIAQLACSVDLVTIRSIVPAA